MHTPPIQTPIANAAGGAQAAPLVPATAADGSITTGRVAGLVPVHDCDVFLLRAGVLSFERKVPGPKAGGGIAALRKVARCVLAPNIVSPPAKQRLYVLPCCLQAFAPGPSRASITSPSIKIPRRIQILLCNVALFCNLPHVRHRRPWARKFSDHSYTHVHYIQR